MCCRVAVEIIRCQVVFPFAAFTPTLSDYDPFMILTCPVETINILVSRVHGACYENISGGHIGNALVDFTGGISEYINLTKGRPANLFESMRHTMKMNSMMGCSINVSTLGMRNAAIQRQIAVTA